MHQLLKEFASVLMRPMAIVGLCGQTCFFSRFLVQWIASERRGESVVPVSFWYISMFGSVLVLAYALWRRDPVITMGQLVGFFVYSRNLVLVRRKRGPNGA